jgi:hypothetical protein
MRRVRVTIAAMEKAIIIIIKYSESVFLALGIQHAKYMRRIISSSVFCTLFFTLSYKQRHFGKNGIEHKMCVLIFYTTFV